MTGNQISYWRTVEERRANKQQEALTARQIAEQQRHNMAYEAEARRHNYATEALESTRLYEVQRANRASELLTSERNAETQRHDEATEQLTDQRNRNDAYLGYQSNKYAGYNARTNRRNADTNRYNAKTQRIGTIGRLVTDGLNTISNIGKSILNVFRK